MKKPALFCVLIFTALNMLAQESITDALLNNSEVIKFKWKFSMTNKDMHKTNIGPFTTADIRQGRQHLIGREKENFIEIRGKSMANKTAVSKIKTQPFSLTILQEGRDSIISNVDLISRNGGDHAMVEMVSGKGTTEEAVKFYCGDMMIQTRKDSLNWQMSKASGSYDADYEDYPLSLDRVLTNGIDKILVRGAEDFPVTRRLFGNTTKGIVFIYNKKQIAALQTYPETMIWFSNSISLQHKQVAAAVMISLLSINADKIAH